MMSHPLFLPYQVKIDSMRLFSSNAMLYRAFDHLIAASDGAVLAVPLILVQGRFDGVVDGCPVPWEEIHATLDPESVPFMMELVHMPAIDAEVKRLAPLGLDGWEFDFIGIHDNTRRNVLRLIHKSGVRFAVASPINNQGELK